jgi:hypothetical protein
MTTPMESMSGSWCTSKRCDGSLNDVAEYLAERFDADSTVVTRVGKLSVQIDTAGPIRSVAPTRVHAARLAFARWRMPASVTIEVLPWSTEQSELLVRPIRRPAGNAYFEAALAVAGALAEEVSAVVGLPGTGTGDEPLRRAS